MSEPFPLELDPGISRAASSNALKGRWYDCDHIRFRHMRPQKVGGCTKLFDDQLVGGPPRGMLGWTTVSGVDNVATGTATRVYSCSDMPDDITPIRESGTLTDPFDTTLDSPIVEVTDVGHGLDEGATVIFDGATAVGGVTIDGEYTVLEVIDADTYTITHSDDATSAATGGGSVDYDYLINPGYASGAIGLGYGVGPYGMEAYGTERSATEAIEFELRTWSFATRNGILYFSPSGGGIYTWDEPNNDPAGVILAGAPTECRSMFITAEGIVVALGTDLGPMFMEWSDRDDVTDWTPADDNTANVRRLLVGNKLVAGTIFATVNLVWSDVAVYRMQYLDGTTFIYETVPIARGCGLLGPCAFAVSPGLTMWVSSTDVYVYGGGGVDVAPRFDEVRDYLFGPTNPYRIDLERADKVVCGYNHKFNEIWIHYVSEASTTDEPDRYVKCNLANWDWDFGSWDRSAMTYLESANGDVIMGSPDGYLFRHEDGHDNDGEVLEAYIETTILTLNDGKTDMDVLLVVPDFEDQAGDVAITLTGYRRPQSATAEDEQEIICAEGSEQEDVRFGGRHVKVRFTSDELGGHFRLGAPTFYTQPAGER